MVVETLSLDTINANSPYEVKLADAVDTLCFIIDYDAEIFVTFDRDELLHEGLVYQFGISNPKRVSRLVTQKCERLFLLSLKNSLLRIKLHFFISVIRVVECRRCVIAYFNIGLEFMENARNMFFYLRR